MIIHNPLTKSVFFVAIFWWVVLTIYAVFTYAGIVFTPRGLSATFSHIITALGTLGLGVVGGVGFTIWKQIKSRIEGDLVLKAKGRLGMLCSIGETPVSTPPFLCTQGATPAWFTDPAVIEHGQVLVDWIRRFAQVHPFHANALVALIRIFAQCPNLPASHVPNGHGGKTLIDHSARVACLMLRASSSFRYDGLKSKYGSEPRGDVNYSFDAEDPLIPLLGMAHDIGKFATFEVDKNGKVVGTKPKHDAVGSRMLATMEEIKLLPAHDQACLHMAVSFYHHPSDYPLNREGRLENDRAVALMMLLIHADKWAGKEEANSALSPEQYANYLRYMQDNGEELSPEELDVVQSAAPPIGAGTAPSGTSHRTDDASVRSHILDILKDPTLVLIANPQGNTFKNAVGQVNYSAYPQWARDWLASGEPLDAQAQERLMSAIEKYVVLHEAKFRLALAKRLGLTDLPKRGDGRYLLTIQALTVLADMGVLYTDSDLGQVVAQSAMYVCAIQNRNTGKELAQWRSTIILRPVGDLAFMDEQKSVHPSLVHIMRPLWKDRLVKGDSLATTNNADSTEYISDVVPGSGPAAQEQVSNAGVSEDDPFADPLVGQFAESETGVDNQTQQVSSASDATASLMESLNQQVQPSKAARVAQAYKANRSVK